MYPWSSRTYWTKMPRLDCAGRKLWLPFHRALLGERLSRAAHLCGHVLELRLAVFNGKHGFLVVDVHAWLEPQLRQQRPYTGQSRGSAVAGKVPRPLSVILEPQKFDSEESRRYPDRSGRHPLRFRSLRLAALCYGTGGHRGLILHGDTFSSPLRKLI